MARKNAVKDNLEQIQHQSYSELQELLSEANSMLADSAAFAGDKADSARARIGALLEKANDALGKGGSAVAERSRHAVDATELYRRQSLADRGHHHRGGPARRLPARASLLSTRSVPHNGLVTFA